MINEELKLKPSGCLSPLPTAWRLRSDNYFKETDRSAQSRFQNLISTGLSNSQHNLALVTNTVGEKTSIASKAVKDFAKTSWKVSKRNGYFLTFFFNSKSCWFLSLVLENLVLKNGILRILKNFETPTVWELKSFLSKFLTIKSEVKKVGAEIRQTASPVIQNVRNQLRSNSSSSDRPSPQVHVLEALPVSQHPAFIDGNKLAAVRKKIIFKTIIMVIRTMKPY